MSGFYPSTAGNTTVTTSGQTNQTIINTATRFTFDKVSSHTTSGTADSLNGVTLTVKGTGDNSKLTYATWSRDDSGSVSVSVWRSGTTDTSTTADYTNTTGYIVGLAAGTYTVTEAETETPTNHDPVADFQITINASTGVVSEADDVDYVEVSSNTVTVTDEVFAGYISLSKTITDTSISTEGGDAFDGSTFSLYRVGTGTDSSAELIAEGITTSDGTWTSVGSNVKFVETATEYTKYGRTILSEGLLDGTYYFVETSTSDNAVLPSSTAYSGEAYQVTLNQASDHKNSDATSQASKTVSITNSEFGATVTLNKFDATTNTGVDGASFTLQKVTTSDGETTYNNLTSGLLSGSTYTMNFEGDSLSKDDSASNSTGVLTLSNLKKGTYRLVENSNQGYNVSDAAVITFTIENEDDGKTFDLASTDAQNTLSAADISSSIVASGTTTGLSNTRLTGTAQLTKIISGTSTGLNGATFKLQKQGSSDTEWNDIATGLVSGNGYVYSSSATTGYDSENVTTNSTGVLTISGLGWGTYRFVETTPAPGYTGVDSDGDALTSGEFTIDRTTVETTSQVSLINSVTSLTIKKTASDGTTALSGGEFTLTGTFSDNTTSKTLTANSDGALVISGTTTSLEGLLVVGNVYTLTETTAPLEYKTGESVTFKVNDDSTITPGTLSGSTFTESSSWPNNYSYSSNDGSVLTVKNERIEFTVTKVASDGTTGISGAKIELTEPDGNTMQKVTDASGKVTFTDLYPVVYTLKEISAPVGYECTTSTLVIQIQKDGTITPGELDNVGSFKPYISTDQIPSGWSVALSGGTNITLADTPIEATLTKISSKSGDTKLSGVTFTLEGIFADGKGGYATYDENDNPTTVSEATLSTRTFTTDANGQIVFDNLVQGQSYKVKETATADGYEINGETLTFRVANDGTGTISSYSSDATDSDYTVNTSAAAITVTDDPIEVMLTKVASGTTTGLQNATFRVSGNFNSATAGTTISTDATTNTTYQDITTDEDGALTIAGLKAGETYTVTEITSPAGYELNSTSFTFKVAEDGSGTISADSTTSGYAINADNASITVTDNPVSITLTKVETNTDTKLSGAEFNLVGTFASSMTGASDTADSTRRVVVNTDASGNVTYDVYTVTTTDNGDGTTSETLKLIADDATSLTGLIVGNEYSLTEVKAPDGYELITGTLAFKVNNDGTVETTSTSGTIANGSIVINSDSADALTASDDPVVLNLIKYAKDSTTTLAGAVLKVVPESGSSFVDSSKNTDGITLTTGEGGKASLSGQLIAGNTYTLSEVTAPSGYTLVTETLRFTVQSDGTFAVADDITHTAFRTSDASGNTISVFTGDVFNDPTKLTIAKISSTVGTQYLGGAEFQLSGTFADNSSSPITLTTGTDGTVSLENAKLIANGETVYTLTETAAPPGYEKNTAMFTFVVETSGAITPVSVDESGAITARLSSNGIAGYSVGGTGSILVTATDSPIQVTLTKSGSAGSATAEATTLADATFKVTGTFGSYTLSSDAILGSDGATYQEVTTNADGSLTINGLIAGNSYTIEETVAPSGYELLTGSLTFKVNTDGTISQESGNIGNGTLSVSDDQITAIDTPIEVTLVKAGAAAGTTEAKSTLTGSTFTVAGKFSDTTAASKSISPDGTDAADTVTGLIAGETYTVTETAEPWGYKELTGSFTFKMNADGSIADLNNQTSNGTVELSTDALTDEPTITVTDEPIVLNLSKINGDSEALANAQFSLKPAEGFTFADSSSDAITLTTDEDGLASLSGMLVAGQSYELTEVKAADGYKLMDGTFAFTVAANGTLNQTDSQSEQSANLKNGNIAISTNEAGETSLVATDDAVVLTITKTGTGSEGAEASPLYNTTLKIEGIDGATFADGETEKQLITDANGTTTLSAQLIVGGTYTLTEVTPSVGYELNTATVTFTVNGDGTFTTVDEGTATGNGTMVVNGDAISIGSESTPIQVTLTKTGAAGLATAAASALAGATFELTGVFADGAGYYATYDADGNVTTSEVAVTSTRTFTADENGQLTFDYLVQSQTYKLTEITAPAGYELIEGSLVFTIDGDNSTVAEDGTGGGNGTGIIVVDEETSSATALEAFVLGEDAASLTATDEPIEINLAKVNTSGTALEGATFTITGTFADTTAISKTVSPAGSDASAIVTGLVAGETYTVVESVTPTGYKELGGNFSFGVLADGTITGLETSSLTNGAVELSSDNLTLTVENQLLDEVVSSVKTSDPFGGLYAMLAVVAVAAVGVNAAARRKLRSRK